MQNRALFGRRVIYVDVAEITPANVVDVLRKAYTTHLRNKSEIEYLYGYYKGRQPILDRTKEVRPEIMNTVVENRALEIVSFKVGYLVGEPIQYVSRGDDQAVSQAVTRLNDYMATEDKATNDKELAEWMHIVGLGYRMVLPNAYADVDDDEDEDAAPFEIYTMDPRTTFVAYFRGLGKRVAMSVNYFVNEDKKTVFCIYTDNMYYEVHDRDLVMAEPQVLGNPIVEYPLNNARLGAFEPVIPMLDAINTVGSNRMDGVEQFIQALMLFHNVDISAEDYKKLRAEGAIKFKDIDPQLKAEIEYLTAELNQAETQTLVNHMYNTVLTICGMPNRNGGSSTSDTGAAVIMRDGWSDAETRAMDTELMFKKPEKKFLKLVLRICRNLADLNLKISSFEARFTRRNYENIVEKANVLTTMLANPKIAPQLAFIHCGMFSDPQIAYAMSVKYMKEQEAKAAAMQKKEGEGNDPGNHSVTESGEGDQ